MNRPRAPDIETARLRLVWMSPRFMEASLAGQLAEAGLAIGAALPSSWPDADVKRRLVMRLAQMRATPGDAEWLLRAILRQEDGALVGMINFHGAPDERNRAELGYTVFEGYRRRGYATEAALAMMRWARDSHAVETFVVSISPENKASLAMAAAMGFRRVGTQLDQEDGEEWVFELAASGLEGVDLPILRRRDA